MLGKEKIVPSVHFKNSKQSLERLKMTTYRVHLKVWIDNKKAPIKAFAFLNDIKKGRMNFFIEKRIAIAKKWRLKLMTSRVMRTAILELRKRSSATDDRCHRSRPGRLFPHPPGSRVSRRSGP